MAHVNDTISIGSQRKRTSEGFLIAPAVIGRVGILHYAPTDPAVASAPAELLASNRSIRILRSESEVFAADSMKSFAGRPVTLEHSAVKVTPRNYKDHLVGITGSEVVRDGLNMKTELTFYAESAIAAIEAGKVQLSQGYDAKTDWTPGVDPMFGEYDGSFSNIVGNHVAITDHGRSGSEVRILDSNNNNMGENIVKRTINGVEIDIPDNVVGVIDSYLASYSKTAHDLNEATGKIAALTGELEAAKAKITEVTDSTYVDTRVKARLAVVEAAKKIAPAVVCDGLTDDAIRAAVIASKGLKLEGADVIRGAFEALAVAAPAVDTKDPAKTIADGLNKSAEKTAEEIYNEARANFVNGANGVK